MPKNLCERCHSDPSADGEESCSGNPDVIGARFLVPIRSGSGRESSELQAGQLAAQTFDPQKVCGSSAFLHEQAHPQLQREG
jgi:hypothetical protein